MTIRPAALTSDSPTQACRRIVDAMIESSRATNHHIRLRAVAISAAFGLLGGAAMMVTAQAALAAPAASGEAGQTPTPVAAPAKPQIVAQKVPAKADQAGLPEVRKYCTNIANAATEARFAWQTAKLNELEIRLKVKIKDLDAKEAELRAWIEKREAIEKEATEKLVGIYSKMRPETAATQISALDDDMAAAVLGQLNPRQASAIFNEIVPDRAAKLAGIIAGANSSDKKL